MFWPKYLISQVSRVKPFSCLTNVEYWRTEFHCPKIYWIRSSPLAYPKDLPRRHEDDGVGENTIQSSSSSINIKHHHYHPHRHQKHHHLHQKHHHYQDAMRIAEMAPRRDLHCQSMQVVKASFHWDPRKPCQTSLLSLWWWCYRLQKKTICLTKPRVQQCEAWLSHPCQLDVAVVFRRSLSW